MHMRVCACVSTHRRLNDDENKLSVSLGAVMN